MWLHAPSVGEGLQARPIAHALRSAHADWQQAYSFFSPSAEPFAPSIRAELCDYLPFDSADAADRLLTVLRPDALVFVKLDVWPVLVERARARGVPVGLVSATLAPNSGRQGAWSRALLHDAYAALDAVGAIDADHGARLTELGVRADALRVTGDTRFDQVAARAAAADRARAPLAYVSVARPTLVAGSTWPADEAALLPAWDRVRQARADVRLIVAPHEPTDAHLSPIVAWAEARRLSLARLTDIEARGATTDADVILVDRVGVLGDLYALADVAFVGGGFHAAGLHSVIEPAAFAVPVIFGLQHRNSREAGLLLADSAAASLGTRDDLADTLTRWLVADAQARAAAGAAGLALVQRELGATARAVTLVEQLVATSPRAR